MNYRMVFGLTGKIITTEAALLLLPAIIALYFGETKSLFAYLIAAAIAAVIGLFLVLCFKAKNKEIYAGEGFVSVALSWIFLSIFGCFGFMISGDIPNFFDAFFETVSGFTTTGASILTDVESVSKSNLFWRSFTHWIGGMGILVFVMAIIPSNAKGTMHAMRAEMPGPIIGKLVPRVSDTAKILYLIYMVLTGVEIVLLYVGGMPLFESVVHSFGTAGTGGFSVKNDGLASYSPYSQWVITVFMLIFGVNFNIYYLLLIKRIRAVLQSIELWFYIVVVLLATTAITVNIFSIYGNLSESLRQSAFQVASIMTTTGFSTTDFNLWPGLSKTILLVLMFLGGCAGSTAGGIKVSRAVLLLKLIARELRRLLHPRSVSHVRFEGKKVEEETLQNVSVYFAIYMVCVVAVLLLISFEPFDLETTLSSTVACFNNVGPGFAGVGPASNYSAYSSFSKAVLSFAMLLGRLEIFPLIIALSPATWSRKRR
ncbi:MAG: TrkH family potassium uptake protein [Clostridia bacterium]|nr:TrkH family potassium uptake protein [Clostridia bacterium]